jgi:hypothetical protein
METHSQLRPISLVGAIIAIHSKSKHREISEAKDIKHYVRSLGTIIFPIRFVRVKRIFHYDYSTMLEISETAESMNRYLVRAKTCQIRDT